MGRKVKAEGDGVEGRGAEIRECAKGLVMSHGSSRAKRKKPAQGGEAQGGEREAKWKDFDSSSAEGARRKSQPCGKKLVKTVTDSGIWG